MIPLRIAVKGFLSYREEQEIGLESSSLWMLAGLNGSGKSAVFDGVTYALFGGHRAGKEHAEELINKNCDAATVEFDFLLDGQRYQARRTLRRRKQGGTQATQQISRWRPADEEGLARWEAIPDTNQKRHFDAWVRDNIGLTYETFTSSVLLMQGRAEKLLAAAPRERFEVLAGIVDLERYQRLHERAEEKRRRFKEQVELLQMRLDELPEVSDAELERAAQSAAAARQAVEASQAEVERLQRLELHAQRWRELQTRLDDIRGQARQAEKLLANGEAIERDAARLRDLQEVLPALNEMVAQRQRLARSRATSAVLVNEQRALAGRLSEVTYALEQNRQKQQLLQQAIAEDQQRAEVVGARLRELSGLLARVSLWEQQRREITRIEALLAELPADPVAAVSQAQQEYDRLSALAHALPLLSRLANLRQELGRLQRSHAGLVAEETQATVEGKELAVECAALVERLEKATCGRREAEEQATEARTMLRQAAQQLEQLNSLDGSKACRFCGQALTPGHLGEERARREKAHAAAAARERQTAAARKEAVEAEKQAHDAVGKVQTALAGLRDRVQECRRQQAENARERRRLIVDGVQAYQELPLTFRLLVSPEGPADLLQTVYPSDDDLSAAREEAKRRPEALQTLQQAQKVLEQWQQFQAQRDAIVRSLQAQEAGLPEDAAALREEHRWLEAEGEALKATLKANRAQLVSEQQAQQRLHREHTLIGEHLAEKGQHWSAEEARREECEKALERVLAALPAAWRQTAEAATADDLERWQAEQRELEHQGAAERFEELTRARAGTAVLQERLRELEGECEQVPLEARTEPVHVTGLRQAARQVQADHETELIRAESARERLAERREKRRELQEEHAEKDRQHNRYRLLAELFGRNRLQLHLVRRAERGIVDYANAVLDRLSGGQLCLRLRGDDSEAGAEQALHLEAFNRVTGQVPIGVSFLSGSQRFRVAVSLALGIGQYASRQHRPIESVIIDEGFGCLDRQGRQVMIQELQNLRGQLRCILLVSHQEEFAEAFADSYRFELTDGSTQVRRLQR